MSFKFSRKSIERLKGVDKRLVKVFTKAIEVSPIDFGIPPDGGLRTAKRQAELYAKGRTAPGDKVTKVDGYLRKSRHQLGEAVDVFAYVNGKASWDKEHLAIIAGVVLAVAKSMKINIRWGGTFGSVSFKGWDRPHYQLEN